MRGWTISFSYINKVAITLSKFWHLLYVFFYSFWWSLIQILLTLFFFSSSDVCWYYVDRALCIYKCNITRIPVHTYIQILCLLSFFFSWNSFYERTRSAAWYRFVLFLLPVCLYVCMNIEKECLTKVKMLNLANRWFINKQIEEETRVIHYYNLSTWKRTSLS